MVTRRSGTARVAEAEQVEPAASSKSTTAPGDQDDDALRKKRVLELCMNFVQTLRHKRWKEALKLAEEILEMEPGNPQVLPHMEMLEDLADASSDSDSSSSSQEEAEGGPQGDGGITGYTAGHANENPQDG
ncbi:unnamed protein product [Amoebophrya sp. A25]|nr:unnamed protein product [Amoebophrya sp. A25]|eukprot:GSA25T00006189001.1